MVPIRPYPYQTHQTKSEEEKSSEPPMSTPLRLRSLPMDLIYEILIRILVKQLHRLRCVSRLHSSLPMDLIYEILIRIPVKQLHRLRCVSRQWYHLISDPSFQKDHDERCSQQSPLLLVLKDDSTTKLLSLVIYNHEGAFLDQFTLPIPKLDGDRTVVHKPLRKGLVSSKLKPFLQFVTSFHIWHFPTRTRQHNRSLDLTFKPIQSCRGLVCFWGLSEPYVLVCNPSTKDLIALPHQGEQSFWCVDCVGFGYAASIDKFKVFKFISRVIDNSLKLWCEVFTLGSDDGWRKARSDPPYWPRYNAPFLNGALHLMPYYGCHGDDYIAILDVDSEEYRGIPLPEIYFGNVEKNRFSSKLMELEGSLCLSFNFFETENMLELWYLNDYPSGKWAKKYNIDLSFDVFNICPTPLAVMADGTILVATEEELRCYNPQENCFLEPIGTSSTALLYTESFIALRSKSTE